MENEKKPAKGQQKNKGNEEISEELKAASTSVNATVNDDIEEEEIPIRSDKTLRERMMLILEKFASYEVGQEVIKRTDRMLEIIEQTSKWSLPEERPEDILERPLPWLPFIALILFLRIVRFWCSAVSLVTRFRIVKPQQMVGFFQNRRRTLRVIRKHGLKTIRNREQQRTVSGRAETVKNVDKGFLRRLGNLVGGAVCKPGQLKNATPRNIFLPYVMKMATPDLGLESEPESSRPNTDGTRKKSRKPKKSKEDDERNLNIDEMLEKYGNEDSDDSDYVPNDDEEEHGSTTTSCTSSAEEIEKENQQATADISNPNESAENQNNQAIENGESKPLVANNEQVNAEQGEESHEKGSFEYSDSNAAAIEVAPPSHVSTPITNTHTRLAVPLLEDENGQKSTPGHKSAASLKPPIVTNISTESQNLNKAKVEEKCYRTITTQTCLEIDWSITIKTEIIHRRTPPKLEKLNYSVQLTPATSDEDIFYSPLGSPQEFHSIFHPAPIVKGSKTEALSSTTQHTDHHKSSNSDTTPKASSSGGPKRRNSNPRNQKQNQNQQNNQKQKSNSRNRRKRR